MAEIRIRNARPQDAAALTGLAMRAKASWGYPPAFMEACRAELTFTAQKLETCRVWVAEVEGAPAGLIGLTLHDGWAELEDFFVEPDRQGQGVGAALLAAFLEACRAAAVACVCVDADPNAEPIYARFGFRTVGRSPSGSIPGRTLPRMELRLDHTIREPSLPQ